MSRSAESPLAGQAIPDLAANPQADLRGAVAPEADTSCARAFYPIRPQGSGATSATCRTRQPATRTPGAEVVAMTATATSVGPTTGRHTTRGTVRNIASPLRRPGPSPPARLALPLIVTTIPRPDRRVNSQAISSRQPCDPNLSNHKHTPQRHRKRRCRPAPVQSGRSLAQFDYSGAQSPPVRRARKRVVRHRRNPLSVHEPAADYSSYARRDLLPGTRINPTDERSPRPTPPRVPSR